MREAVKAFDQVAGFYDDWYSHPQGRQVFEVELTALESLIPDSGLGLEVGAGTGVFAESLSEKDRTIICLDPSGAMLAKARERKMPAIIGVGEHIPITKGAVSFAYMATTLEFLENPVAAFNQVRETTKKDAPLTILFINADSAWGSLYRRIGVKGDPVFRHARLRSLPEVHEILVEAGYVIQESVGTLTTGPAELDVGIELKEPGPETGVIVVRASPEK
ncbi:MAG TPA: class I SAM-dependent methyltransferase [Candidatus Krumholzibacteriaceae bacterium]|nr:class I SAM-dependent methyltransferase [Candidatus Krumholzibacteriaceae bacterium]